MKQFVQVLFVGGDFVQASAGDVAMKAQDTATSPLPLVNFLSYFCHDVGGPRYPIDVKHR